MLGGRHLAVAFSFFHNSFVCWGQWPDGMFVREEDSSLMLAAFAIKVQFVVFWSLYSIVL